MDEAKNMALLFFMDHLMQKNGRRTIHDLSCQFGARGFTPEMRDAVGTTQEGLTDFLNQHPSLFTVEGDQVCLNGFGDITAKNNPLLQATANGRNRDYEKEAVQFFEAKLQKFGPELQIKSLLGHRSQAAPEVRLVSGRHLKDFCEFLQSKSDYFVVEGDRVRLKNMPEPSHAGVELDDEGKPLAGVKAKQAAVEYLRSVVEMKEDQPIPMDVFYQKFCDRFSHTVRQEVATNPKELLQFLKLNRNVFFIRSNKVSLVKNRTSEDGSESGSTEGSELENNNNNGILTQNTLNRINLVKALKPAQEAINSVNAEIDAMEEKVIGVDFKTVTLGVQGEEFLSLVVLATQNQIVVFDLVHSDTILLESGLKEILESEKILKVMHEAKRVASLLAHRYAVNIRKVFDTQIAHAVLQHEKFGKALSEMRSISFLNLQRVYYPQSIMMSDATPRKLTQQPSILCESTDTVNIVKTFAFCWGQRPITDEMLISVVEEAHCLVTVIYRMLSNMLPNHLRPLFEAKCVEALLATPNRPPPTTLQANGAGQYRNSRRSLASPTNHHNNYNNTSAHRSPSPRQTCEVATQTFSTGEINVIDIYYDS